MAKSLPRDIPDILVLFLVNVSEPLREIDVVNNLRATLKFPDWREDVILEKVRKGLASLTTHGYALQTPDGRYALTYSGIHALAEKKVAFPRDKHRLYFLKEALRRRGSRMHSA
jgi:hypothetical protein